MIVRRPNFDFSDVVPHWAPGWEFAQMFNAQSMLFPPLEAFLNRVMLMARAEITGDDPKSARLREDINLFIRQESVHLAIHADFNKVLERAGFDCAPAWKKDPVSG